jgi:predicted secreted acid phosphatase
MSVVRGNSRGNTLKSVDTAVKHLYMRRGKKKDVDTIIFDIDGTLVRDEMSCITPIVSLYKKAIALGYEIYIITARLFTADNYTFTVEMLKKCGIVDYSGIFMRPGEMTDLHYYKASRREALVKRGYNIIMSVGDQDFDFGKNSGVNIWVY